VKLRRLNDSRYSVVDRPLLEIRRQQDNTWRVYRNGEPASGEYNHRRDAAAELARQELSRSTST